MATSCAHPTGTIINPADHREGARCDDCGQVLPVNGVPLGHCPDCRRRYDHPHLGGCLYHPDPARRHPFGNTLKGEDR